MKMNWCHCIVINIKWDIFNWNVPGSLENKQYFCIEHVYPTPHFLLCSPILRFIFIYNTIFDGRHQDGPNRLNLKLWYLSCISWYHPFAPRSFVNINFCIYRVQTNLENLVNLEKQTDFGKLRENLGNSGNLRKNADCSWKTQGIFFCLWFQVILSYLTWLYFKIYFNHGEIFYSYWEWFMVILSYLKWLNFDLQIIYFENFLSCRIFILFTLYVLAFLFVSVFKEKVNLVEILHSSHKLGKHYSTMGGSVLPVKVF